MIYKLLSAQEWEKARKYKVFSGSADDLRDGFIHFSTAGQLRETAAKHFAGGSDLVLLGVETGALGPALKWEISRGGAKFPHLYGVLPLAAVRQVSMVLRSADGTCIFPSGIP